MPAPAEASAVVPAVRPAFRAGRPGSAAGGCPPREAREAAVRLPRPLAAVTACEAAPEKGNKGPGVVTGAVARVPGGKIPRSLAAPGGGRAGSATGLAAARLHRGGARLPGAPFTRARASLALQAARETAA